LFGSHIILNTNTNNVIGIVCFKKELIVKYQLSNMKQYLLGPDLDPDSK